MSFQAYLDSIKAKTGKTPADFAKLAAKKGLTKHGDVIAWLKKDFELGHGHANAIAAVLLKPGAGKASAEEKLESLFSGTKASWRRSCDKLFTQVKKFGADVAIEANETYVNLLRDKKKFGIVKPASAERLDVGIKAKALKPTGRLEASGSWNAMVTHRVKIADPKEIDAELVAWLRVAYDGS